MEGVPTEEELKNLSFEEMTAKMLAARVELLKSMRRAGVSASLIQKITNCYDYLSDGGMGKTVMVTQHLIYYLSQADKERSAVAALGYLVEEEPCSTEPASS